MNDLSLKSILDNARAWPEEDQQELADYARIIEARRQKLYRLDAAEREAIEAGLDDADNGNFASESDTAASAKRFGL